MYENSYLGPLEEPYVLQRYVLELVEEPVASAETGA